MSHHRKERPTLTSANLALAQQPTASAEPPTATTLSQQRRQEQNRRFTTSYFERRTIGASSFYGDAPKVFMQKAPRGDGGAADPHQQQPPKSNNNRPKMRQTQIAASSNRRGGGGGGGPVLVVHEEIQEHHAGRPQSSNTEGRTPPPSKPAADNKVLPPERFQVPCELLSNRNTTTEEEDDTAEGEASRPAVAMSYREAQAEAQEEEDNEDEAAFSGLQDSEAEEEDVGHDPNFDDLGGGGIGGGAPRSRLEGGGKSRTARISSSAENFMLGDGEPDDNSSSEMTSDSQRGRGGLLGFLSMAGPHMLITGGAMLVPIIFLFIVASINLADAVKDLDIIDSARPFILSVSACNSHHMAERGQIGPWIVTGSDEAKINITNTRRATDACRRDMIHLLRELAVKYKNEYGPVLDRFNSQSSELAVARSHITARTTTGKAERELLTRMIQFHADLTLLVDEMLIRPTTVLKQMHAVQTLINYLGYGRGVGNAIAFVPNGTNVSVDRREEFLNAFFRTELTLELVEALHVEQWAVLWAEPSVVSMWGRLKLLASIDGHLEIRKSPDDWWPILSRGIVTVEEHFLVVKQRFSDAASSKALVRDESIKLVFGVLLCFVAACFLAFYQARLRMQLYDQIIAIATTKKAIAAFVPRAFLSTMGYTSITQVQPGDRTETALAMVFADIQHFTTVAEGMGNTELFDWVQQYFARMARVIEKGRGNINQFIGDGLFAVFKSSTEACRTAVAMHADVERMNITNRCRRADDVPVQIGIGVHQGCVALGVLGDGRRQACTLISASVSLASRIEAVTKQLRCRIIASSSVMEAMTLEEQESIRSRNIGDGLAKGMEDETLFEIFQSDDQKLQLYKLETKEDFEEAVALFSPTTIDIDADDYLPPRVLHALVRVCEMDRGDQDSDEDEEDQGHGADAARSTSHEDAQFDPTQWKGTPPDAAVQTAMAGYRQRRRGTAASGMFSIVSESVHQDPSTGFPQDGDVVANNNANSASGDNGPLSIGQESSTERGGGDEDEGGARSHGADSRHTTSRKSTRTRTSQRHRSSTGSTAQQKIAAPKTVTTFAQAYDALAESFPDDTIKGALIRRMIAAQRRHKVIDEVFLRLLLHHHSKPSLVFSSRAN